MDMITVSAKTLDEAITKALIQLETTSEHLHYEVIDKGSSGLLGIFGTKPCVIRAKVMSEQEEKAAKKEAEAVAKRAAEEEAKKVAEAATKKKVENPVKIEVPKVEAEVSTIPKESAAPVVSKERKLIKADEALVQKKAKEFLVQVFGAMGMEVVIETSFDQEEGELQVMMSGADMGVLIGKRGQTLDSLQYLVSLVVNKETEGYMRVKLDTENYRERRKETLESLAKNISYKVKRTKRPVSLEPMNPYERRIIHSALQGDKYVTTRSEGEDPYRHVVIALKKEGYSGYNGKRDSRYHGNSNRRREEKETQTEA